MEALLGAERPELLKTQFLSVISAIDHCSPAFSAKGCLQKASLYLKTIYPDPARLNLLV
jgi:hypothetical protein